jgi:hypothetical protein
MVDALQQEGPGVAQGVSVASVQEVEAYLEADARRNGRNETGREVTLPSNLEGTRTPFSKNLCNQTLANISS